MQIQNTVQRYRGTRDVCHTSCTLLAFLSEGLQYLDAPLENDREFLSRLPRSSARATADQERP